MTDELNKYGHTEYKLRKSQQEAVDGFIDYMLHTSDIEPKYCYNAVMRWGKCFVTLDTIYEFNKSPEVVAGIKKPIRNALILTFFPAVEDSWSRLFAGGSEAQEKFDGFNFISLSNGNSYDPDKVNVYFSSFQEIYNGKDKKSIFYDHGYDLLVMDEYHYGAYNAKARNELRSFSEDAKAGLNAAEAVLLTGKLRVKYKLTLTGTPYRLFANSDEYSKQNGNLFRFSYFDEQQDRLDNGEASDYRHCPRLHLYSVNIVKDECITLYDKIDYLLSNGRIFSPDALDVSMFGKPGAASMWLIGSVKDADTIEKYIDANYPGEYNVINLYSKANRSANALDAVRASLNENADRPSIILSYNKLTLGVTIPEIESVVFLRDVTTAELYMQAACRAKSQYPDKSKKEAYVISFDINNDYSIFSEITRSGMKERDFIKLFPITFVDYDFATKASDIKDITGKVSFLDALAKVPTEEMVRRSISRSVKILDDIPPELIGKLLAVHGIGQPNVKLAEKVKDVVSDPRKLAESKGKTLGRRDKEEGKPNNCPKFKYSDEQLQKAFEFGYSEGYHTVIVPVDDIADKKEKKKAEENANNFNDLVYRIQVLTKRFVYVLISDYFRENRVYDIDDAEKIPVDFFASMLGFDPKDFIALYEARIFDQAYIDQAVGTFKNKESVDTVWLGLAHANEYVDKAGDEQSPEFSVEELDEPEEPAEDVEQPVTTPDDLPADGKVIYIAVRSADLENEITTLKTAIATTVKGSILNESLSKMIGDREACVPSGVVKIGETTRDVSARIEELNGYILAKDYHPFFDIYKYLPAGPGKSDIDFHRWLEARGYKRVQDPNRREFFEIDKDKAFVLLQEYIEEKPAEKASARITRKALPRMNWMLEQGLINIGDEVVCNGNTAKVVDDKTVNFDGLDISFYDFGLMSTGYKAINVYENMSINGHAETLHDIRCQRMRELGMLDDK